MRRAPMLVPAVALLTAIVAQAHGFGFAALSVAIVVLRLRPDAALGCLFGLIVGALHGHPAVVEREYPTARYTGTVVGDVRSEDGSASFPFAVSGIGTLRAIVHARVRPGERLMVRARISPLDEARNPGEPSPRALALDEGVVGQITIRTVLAREPPDTRDPRVWTAIVRTTLSEFVRSTLPEPEATVLAGALWGERGTLPQTVRDDFQATGTVHVLVTAGLHLGVIAGLTAGFFALLRVPRVAAALATIPIIASYAWLSGWHLPSQRATVMIGVALAARACGARAFSLNTLALAALVVASWWPVAVESVSFALSFSCVAAIVIFAEPIAEWMSERRVPPVLAETLALTVSTQIGVWPLTAAVFFVVAPYAIIANALVVPVIGVTMCVGIAAVLAHPIGGLDAVFLAWEQWLLAIVLFTTHVIAGLPGARLTMSPPPGWAIAAYDAGAIGAAVLMRNRPTLAITTIAIACAGVALSSAIHPPSGFSITALDVGQGDSLVIRTPHGRTIMIDTGGRLERGPSVDGRSPAEQSGERIVVPFLQRAGIHSIDLMILTHPHGDHVGAASAILKMMPVGWVADSGQRYGGRAYNDGLAAARIHRVPVVVPQCHQHWVDDEVTFTFLSPCGPQFTDGANDVNENSLVVLVQYRTLRALFMGDAGFQSEKRLLSQGVDVHADILKVGHHGSAYSSSAAFIAAVHPRIAIVSVGRHNLFGHPAPSTLETLRLAGASTVRTDQCGAVAITPGVTAKLNIETMVSCSTAFISEPTPP